MKHELPSLSMILALSAVVLALTPTSSAADTAALFPSLPLPVSALGPVTALTEESTRSREDRNRSAYRTWKWSVAAVTASQAMDAGSSWGLRELNPVLAGASGNFGMQAAAVKFGATGAILGMEYLLIKKHPGAARIVSKLNFSSAVVTGAFAAHNFAIK